MTASARRRRLPALWAAVGLSVCLPALGRAAPRLLIVPIEGTLGAGGVDRAITGIEDALAQKKLEHVFFELSLTGGAPAELLRLTDYVVRLRERSVRTYAFVLDEASPGPTTVLAFACQTIAVMPAVRLGAMNEVGFDQAGRDRVLAWAKDLGRPVALVKRMLELGEELSAYRLTQPDSWSFMTRSEHERMPEGDKRGRLVDARRLCDDDKPVLLGATAGREYGIIQFVEVDRKGVIIRVGLQGLPDEEYAEVGGRDPFGRESSEVGKAIAEFIQQPFIRFLLIMGGILLLFLEFHLPGFGVPGVIGLACFAILFASGLYTGHVSYPELGLFLVSVILLLLELLVIPGFGVAGILGSSGLVVSLVLAMHMPAEGNGPFQWQDLWGGVVTTVLSLSCAIVSIVACAKFLPGNPLMRRAGLVHDAEIAGTSFGPGAGAGGEAPGGDELAGQVGIAVTNLRPAGKARVGGKLLDVVAEADFVALGTPILVVRRVDMRIIVRPHRAP